MDGYSKTTIVLLIVFFIAIISGCGKDSSLTQSQNYADYENVNYWTLSNSNSRIIIDDSISFEGSYSVKIVNDGCSDIKPSNVFSVESNQDYEISVAIMRHENDIESKAGVSIGLDDVIIETWVGSVAYTPIEETASDSISVIVTQLAEIIMFETATINEDATWETKTFSFRTESDEPIEIFFVPGCELQWFSLDSFSINSVLSD